MALDVEVTPLNGETVVKPSLPELLHFHNVNYVKHYEQKNKILQSSSWEICVLSSPHNFHLEALSSRGVTLRLKFLVFSVCTSQVTQVCLDKPLLLGCMQGLSRSSLINACEHKQKYPLNPNFTLEDFHKGGAFFMPGSFASLPLCGFSWRGGTSILTCGKWTLEMEGTGLLIQSQGLLRFKYP